MKKSLMTTMMKKTLINLPSPSNINSMWNFGSILGLCLMIQISTGLFLSMHYCPNIDMAFSSMIHICRNVNYGWLMRTIHANGASVFFICLYIHIGRGMYFNSFNMINTWMIGVTIFLSIMATAFLGYVLPWGQMSFWGATVITNLLSAIPYVGKDMVQWVWGGFAVDNATLTRFFALHFLMPFIVSAMIIMHLMYLHETGSNNPLGLNSKMDMIPFHPFFTFKDMMGFILTTTILIFITLQSPYILGDPDNFTPANPLVTPIHIQPEWYFLFAYAILRSIPNKLGGVIALVMSISILYTMPLMNNKKMPSKFYPMNKILFWTLVVTVMMLTWIGARPVEAPYVLTGQVLTIMYFSYYLANPMMIKLWNQLIK